MKKARLLKLADLLDTVSRTRFNMADFGDASIEDKKKCGTTACAAGWACTIPSFKRAGLKRNSFGIPQYKDCGGPFASLSEFFDIPYDDALYLFDLHKGHETPKQVARNIRKYTEGKLKCPL